MTVAVLVLKKPVKYAIAVMIALVRMSRQMSAPRGIDTMPSARDIPHSRPAIRTTWNVWPRTKTIEIWMPISGTRQNWFMDQSVNKVVTDRTQ